jgi:2-methylisocitrate lyase-like PEP mutase family enzyme
MDKTSARHVSLRNLLAAPGGVVAPLVLNPLMAKLAESAGFKAAYLGGGAMGYQNCATEANLALTQMVHAGVEIKAQSQLPLILDGTCGWGDPMHVRNTIRFAEAAGFAAIEIEDQLLPKRAHHHIGIEHLIPQELMVDKVAEAVAARRDGDFLIIARTNAPKTGGMDEALRRAEAFHRAGADVLLAMARNPEDLRVISERLPHPLMYILPGSGIAAAGISLAELAGMGFALVVDTLSPLFAIVRAVRYSYAALGKGLPNPIFGENAAQEEKLIHEAIDLSTLLDIERRTVER